MKKLRKVNQRKRKQRRKEAQAALERQTAMLLDHPTECCVCHTQFERTQQTVTSWHVTTREDRVRLTCPACWQTINEALEKLNAT